MKKDKTPVIDMDRLCRMIRRGRQNLEKARMDRLEMVSHIAGSRYGNNNVPKVLSNNVSMFIRTVKRNLISKNPRVMLTTEVKEDKAPVAAMERWVNKRLEEIYFDQTMDIAVTDALVYMGIVMVSLLTPAESAVDGFKNDAGEVGIAPIDLDDFCCDPFAKSWETAEFMGHRFKVPMSYLKDSDMYDQEQVQRITLFRNRMLNEGGDPTITTIGVDSRGSFGEDGVEDHVHLWQIYVRRHNTIITMFDSGNGPEIGQNFKPLRMQDWIGPVCGPYHILGFGRVNGNLLPKSPSMDLIDLDIGLNDLYRKSMRQAIRQKKIAACNQLSEEEGRKVKNAEDGEMISMKDTKSVVELGFGGVDANNFAFILKLQEEINQKGGNIALMGGLAAQSQTATQDKILNENSSATIVDLQATTALFIQRVIQSLMWYWWHDPFKIYKTRFEVDGLPEFSVVQQIPVERRTPDAYKSMSVRIDPFSLVMQTPQQKAQKLSAIVQREIMPMMPLLQQRGIAFDIQKYLELQSELLDLPELMDLMTVMQTPQPETQSTGPEGPGMLAGPQDYEKNYNRTSTSARTPQGDSMNMMNQLMGIDPGGVGGGGAA